MGDIGAFAAQKTEYGGTWYRSKLEAKTAAAFDNLSIPYQYEPQGYQLSNGMWYRPDFWLPTCRTFVECKGRADEQDMAKIVGLVEDCGCPVLVISYDNAMLVMRFWNGETEGQDDIVSYSGSVALAKCAKCGGRWFMSQEDTYKCLCCGEYDGDHHLREVLEIESGQMLFDWGQNEAASSSPIYRSMADKFNNE